MNRERLINSGFTRDGNFLITLNNARTKDLSEYASIKDEDIIDTLVITGESSAQKQFPALSRASAVLFILDSPKVKKESWGSDLNNDGVVNSLDYAIFFKRLLAK